MKDNIYLCLQEHGNLQIMEITAAKDIIFALASSGVCVAYARGVKGEKWSVRDGHVQAWDATENFD